MYFIQFVGKHWQNVNKPIIVYFQIHLSKEQQCDQNAVDFIKFKYQRCFR